MHSKKIINLHAKLSRQKDVEIHSFKVHSPLPSEKFKRICNEYKLPDQLISFYKDMNGCQLSYTFSSNKGFDKKKFGQYETVFPYLWPDEVYW